MVTRICRPSLARPFSSMQTCFRNTDKCSSLLPFSCAYHVFGRGYVLSITFLACLPRFRAGICPLDYLSRLLTTFSGGDMSSRLPFSLAYHVFGRGYVLSITFL